MTSRVIDNPNHPLGATSSERFAARTAPVSAGDDLEQARHYCTLARNTMDEILMADRGRKNDPGRDRHWLSEKLADLQRGAKRLRALAIYRATQDVLNLLENRHGHAPINWARVDGRLMVVNKLIRQYMQGCAQVDAMRGEEGVDVERSETRPDGPVIKRYSRTDIDTPAQTDDARSVRSEAPEKAPVEPPLQSRADTLSELLPHASADECEALSRLIDYASSPFQVSDDDNAPEEEGALPNELVAALPDLVQDLLSEGRDYGKTLSISYALDGIYLTDHDQSSLIKRLHARLSDVIAGSMPLQGVGHIDLSKDGESLRISGSGFEPFEIDIEVNSTAYRDDDTSPQPPRINDDTEAELRAQLSALMDGGLTFDCDAATGETKAEATESEPDHPDPLKRTGDHG